MVFSKLHAELKRQIEGLEDIVEIRFKEDNKQISVGAKRQLLLQEATGDYISFFDSDDVPFSYYVKLIIQALAQSPDCVGFLIHMTTNGQRPQVCCHSLQYPEWEQKVDGYDYVRNVTHFNPVRRDLALKIGFKDVRYGEDRKYSDAVTKLCKKEVFINKKLFHYKYSTAERHKIKYGIR